MQLENYFEFFENGDIRLKGHRIGIEDVLYEYLCNDQSPEELAIRFPTITLEQIYATILYYLHNKEQVTDYMNDWAEHGNRMRELQKQNPTPAIIRLRKIAAEQKAAQRKIA
ncbi:MAG: DUF433 domain-containing protein [Desulfobacteraceae bacterium]|nr:DUF433 domain-containing protein [Desulfobacteraceae bacterium]